jgi:predicted RNA-binding Zn-ribbon protein involved in translation (DUF1610 family)
MTNQCSNCEMRLAQSWTFCPHCGVAIVHETQHHEMHNIEPTPLPQKTSVKGGFGGLLVGLVITPVCIIVGTLLCLTGLGALLGVPMIIGGIIAPLAGSIFGLGEHRGKCPSCGTRVISFTDGLSHDCPTCNKEFAIGQPTAAKAG